MGHILTFVLMGVWHGTQPRHLINGFYHALLFIGFDHYSVDETLG